MAMQSFRVTRVDDGRTFSMVGRGFDAYGIIADAIASEFEVSPYELSFEEEYDDNGEWTGCELVSAHGKRLARIVLP